MGFKSVADLDCEVTIQIGGKDKKTGKPNPKSIQGFYIGFKTTTSKFGEAKLHIFQTEKGNVGVWGKTDMDNKLLTAKPGEMTRVTFTGTVPSKKGNDMWKYKVEIDADQTIEVADTSEPQGDQEPETEDYGATDDGQEESEPDAEEEQPDEVPPARATPPRQPAQAPSAARQATVNALLKGRKAS